MSLPLAGQTVLITRAPEQSGELAERLRALGAEPIEVPTIEVGPPESWEAVDAAIARIRSFDWLVVTSVNGVRHLHERLKTLPEGLRLAVVGPRTAEAARDVGWAPVRMPDRYDGAALAEALAGEAAGKRFLLARGDLAGRDLPEGLRAAGGLVEEVTVYTNRPCEAGRAVGARLSAGRIDWALFASGSAFRNLVALLEDPTALRRIKLASIGPKTSEVMRDLGFEPTVEAAASTLEALVEAVARA